MFREDFSAPFYNTAPLDLTTRITRSAPQGGRRIGSSAATPALRLEALFTTHCARLTFSRPCGSSHFPPWPLPRDTHTARLLIAHPNANSYFPNIQPRLIIDVLSWPLRMRICGPRQPRGALDGMGCRERCPRVDALLPSPWRLQPSPSRPHPLHVLPHTPMYPTMTGSRA